MHAETERHQRAGVGADAKEGDVAKRELPRIAEEQVQAHRGDNEDHSYDKNMHHIEVRHPERDGEEEEQPERGQNLLHPTLSFRANSPVGLKTRIRMMSRKPMASR